MNTQNIRIKILISFLIFLGFTIGFYYFYKADIEKVLLLKNSDITLMAVIKDYRKVHVRKRQDKEYLTYEYTYMEKNYSNESRIYSTPYDWIKQKTKVGEIRTNSKIAIRLVDTGTVRYTYPAKYLNKYLYSLLLKYASIIVFIFIPYFIGITNDDETEEDPT